MSTWKIGISSDWVRWFVLSRTSRLKIFLYARRVIVRRWTCLQIAKNILLLHSTVNITIACWEYELAREVTWMPCACSLNRVTTVPSQTVESITSMTFRSSIPLFFIFHFFSAFVFPRVRSRRSLDLSCFQYVVDDFCLYHNWTFLFQLFFFFFFEILLSETLRPATVRYQLWTIVRVIISFYCPTERDIARP